MPSGILMPIIFLTLFQSIGAAAPTDAVNRASIGGKVTEKTDGHPIACAEVMVLKEGQLLPVRRQMNSEIMESNSHQHLSHVSAGSEGVPLSAF